MVTAESQHAINFRRQHGHVGTCTRDPCFTEAQKNSTNIGDRQCVDVSGGGGVVNGVGSRRGILIPII